MTVGLIIVTYNLPADIFLLQQEAIKKFCKDTDYTVEIIDNSSNFVMSKDLHYHAGVLGCNYHRTHSSSYDSSDSHSFAANFSWQKLKTKYDMTFYMDHDLIPMRDFSVESMLGDPYLGAGLGQGAKKTYFWPGCAMFNNALINRDIVDFSTNGEYGLDTGGNLYKLIEYHGKDKFIFFNEGYHENPHFKDSRYGYYATINDDMFIHLVAASNWANISRNEERLNSLRNLILEKIG